MRLRVFLCAASTLLALTVVAGWSALTPPLPSGGAIGPGIRPDPAPDVTSAPPTNGPEPSATVTHRERVVTIEAVPTAAATGDAPTQEPADRSAAAARPVEPTRVRPTGGAGSGPDDRRPDQVPDDRKPPRN